MTVTRTLQRLVFPTDRDTDVFPLYVDAEHAVLDAEREEYLAYRAGFADETEEVRA